MYTRVTQTHTPRDNLVIPIHLNLFFWGRQEILEETPVWHEESVQAPHTWSRSQRSDPPMLITVPLHHAVPACIPGWYTQLSSDYGSCSFQQYLASCRQSYVCLCAPPFYLCDEEFEEHALTQIAEPEKYRHSGNIQNMCLNICLKRKKWSNTLAFLSVCSLLDWD